MDISAAAIEALKPLLGERIQVSRYAPLSGGSINQSGIVTLADGARYFVKTHDDALTYPGMFEVEHLALQRIAASNTVRVPTTLVATERCIMQAVFERGQPGPRWHETIGRQLAALHRQTSGERFGFDRDGFIGTTVQDNTWCDSWLEFWREHRLGKQMRMLSRQIGVDDPLLKALEKLNVRLDGYLETHDEPPVLIHGDLWSGNAAADENGEPIIFDPASYYASREAELGMMRLFGGFGPTTEAAYAEVWPLAPGSDQRIAIYRLYHELNHLIIFGGGYYQGALSTTTALI